MKNKSIKIIAEVGVNHNGNVQSAQRYIKAAKDAGADAVKFQLFTSEKLVTEDANTAKYQKNQTGSLKQKDLLKGLELTKKHIIYLKKYAEKLKIEFICTPFDIDSLKFLINQKISCLKLSSGDFDNIFMHEEIIKHSYPVILSTGMSDLEEIKKVFNLYKSKGHTNFSFLHCVSIYPADLSLINLSFIKTLENSFPDISIGFSDHTSETISGALSVVAGAKIIEKHITFSNHAAGPDHKASLTISNFRKYVNNIRVAEESIGDGKKYISREELEVKRIARRSLAYSNTLKKGTKIKKNDLISLRPNIGISTFRYKEVVGNILKKNVRKNSLIKLSDFIK